MTTLAELAADVYTITNRPDRTAETSLAIKAATLRAHRLDFFSKDLYSTSFEFDTSDYTQTLDYITEISNFRALSYIRFVYDSTTIPADPLAIDATNPFADIVSPQEILDSYGYNRSNIAYVAGRTIKIRAAEQFNKILLGCFVLPIVTPDDNYSSWVADLYPYLIVYDAAAQVFASIGKAEESARYKAMALEQEQTFIPSALADHAY